MSELIHLRPSFSATAAVVPLPPKKSAIREFSSDKATLKKVSQLILAVFVFHTLYALLIHLKLV